MNPDGKTEGRIVAFFLCPKTKMEGKMVSVIINGKKKGREFQNMAQALAYAYQNGECYAAEKVELVYAKAKAEKVPETPVVETPEVPAAPETPKSPEVPAEDTADAVIDTGVK